MRSRKVGHPHFERSLALQVRGVEKIVPPEPWVAVWLPGPSPSAASGTPLRGVWLLGPGPPEGWGVQLGVARITAVRANIPRNTCRVVLCAFDLPEKYKKNTKKYN